MDIEHLTKTQIVLLVLLCTFVASIATGIVTVSLLAQAPPAVTQTVNHIIQRTVEAVAPTGTTPTTVKETTVVVKEDELLSSTISASFAKIGAVHEGVSSTSPVIALATVVGNVLLTDSSVVSETNMVTFGDLAQLYKVKTKYTEVGIAVMEPADAATKVPAGFRVADTSQIKLGASVITLPSATGTRVGIGAVTARYNLGHVVDGKDDVVVRALDTNIGGKVTPGAPLLNAFGDLIGVSTGISQGAAGGPGTFVGVSDLTGLFLGVRGTSTTAVSTDVQKAI